MNPQLERKLDPQPCSVCCGSKLNQCHHCYGSGNVICISCFGSDTQQGDSFAICSGQKHLECSACCYGKVSCGVCGGTGQRW